MVARSLGYCFLFLFAMALIACTTQPELVSTNLAPISSSAQAEWDTKVLGDYLGGFYSDVRAIETDAVLLPTDLGNFVDWTHHENLLVFSHFSTGMDVPQEDKFLIYSFPEGGIRSFGVSGKRYGTYGSAFQSANPEEVFIRILDNDIRTILYEYEKEVVLQEIRGYVMGVMPDGTRIIYRDYSSDQLFLLDLVTEETAELPDLLNNSGFKLLSAWSLVVDSVKENLAFIVTSKDETGNEKHEIVVVDIATLRRRTSTTLLDRPSVITWLPSSSLVLVQSGVLLPEFSIYDVTQNCITNSIPIGPFRSIRISPSGEYVVLISAQNNYYAIVRYENFMKSISPLPSCF